MKKTSPGLNLIVSALLTLAVVLITAVIGDFYFDLNDDVLMKDILSGAYTGLPAGHNIQMLYPISALIALVYRIARGLDWYGIFLCACQFGCVFIIALRLLDSSTGKWVRTVLAAFWLLFVLGAMLPHFVFVQYTFTCGFLSMTAALLIITGYAGDIRGRVLSVFLIILAYLIRSEMLLLTLPVVGVALLIRWLTERQDLSDHVRSGVEISGYGERKKLFKSYLILGVSILLGLTISNVINTAAYSSPKCKEFNALFDARTELYDFQYIPDYQENRDFYDSIGISQAEQELLVNYNFGIDDEIDAGVLDSVAEYAASLRTDETPLPERLRLAISSYLYRLRHVAYQKSYEYPMTDAPLNVIVIFLYLGTAFVYLISGHREKKLPAVLFLLLLFACRSTLWLYIIVRGRDPIRITHPLYLMEIAVLVGLLMMADRDKMRYVAAPLVAAAIFAGGFIPNQLGIIRAESFERGRMRSHYDALQQYFEDHPDNFYFVDVYTSVSATEGTERTFSEKMFEDVNNSLANHDLMGGWASKSPLYYDKLKAFGFESMQDAILEDNVYVVDKSSQDIGWLSDYYLDKGIETEITAEDTVAEVFVIYKVSRAD
jgi:hypothetical protein